MKIRVAVTCAVLLTCIAAWCVAKCGGAGPVDLEQSSDPGMVESGNEQTEPKPEGALAADGTERKTLPSAPAEAEGAGEPKEPDDPGAVPGELLVRVTWKNDNKPAASIGVHVQPSGAAGAARTAKRLQRGLTTRSIARLAMTGADGVARLQLLPGKFVVGVDRAHTTKTVEVEARETAVASFALDPGIDVNGLVVDPFDNPVPGADIVAFRQHPGRSWLFRLTRTDKGGRFRLRGVMAYYQRIGARTREHGTSDFFMMVPGKAEPGEATFLRLKLPGVSATLRGVVRGATGQPLADAWVKVGSQETRLPGNAVTPPVVHAATDAQGRFQFDALRPGEHTLRVFAAGHAPYREQVQCHGIRPAELTIQLQQASTLRGRVLDQDGRPVSKTHVELRGVEWPTPSSARPDDQGRFEIGGLPARQLEVLVFRDGTAAMSTTVELPVAGTAARDFVLAVGHLLQGILVDERGTPLVGWRVYHNSTDKSIPRKLRQKVAVTDKQGRFRITNCQDHPYDLTVASKWGPQTVPTTILRGVQPDAEPRTYKILDDWSPSAVIRGRVFAADGKPLKGATITLNRDGYHYWQMASPTNAEGSFTTMRLPPGRYKLHIGHPRHMVEKLTDVVVTKGQELMLEPVVMRRREKR